MKKKQFQTLHEFDETVKEPVYSIYSKLLTLKALAESEHLDLLKLIFLFLG